MTVLDRAAGRSVRADRSFSGVQKGSEAIPVATLPEGYCRVSLAYPLGSAMAGFGSSAIWSQYFIDGQPTRCAYCGEPLAIEDHVEAWHVDDEYF